MRIITLRHTPLLIVFSLLSLVASWQPSSGSDWPQFRGPGGLGVSGETELPTTWSDSESLVWRLEMPGFGASSPIALGDNLYLTCFSGWGTGEPSQTIEDLRLHVISVDRDQGKIAWNQTIKPKLPETERVRDHGYSAPTPTTDGSAVYVFFGKTGLFRFDLTGKQIWHADVGSKTHGWGCGSSPVLYEGLVIVNASVESGLLVAIDKETGEQVWEAKGMNRSWNTPHLVSLPGGKTELVVSVKDYILAFDPASGQELWRCDGIHDYVCPSLISNDGIVYAIGGRQSRTIAVRAGGRGDVTESHIEWTAKAGSNVTSPVIYGEHIYWVSDRNKLAYCIRLRDGEVVYAKRFPSQPYASALAGDGKIYIVTRHGGTYVLAAQPQFKQLAHNRLTDDSTFNASPIVSRGQLFLRSDRFLYCIDSRDIDP